MRNISEIADIVRRGERISSEDALTLWREAPLWLLGELAVGIKRAKSGDKVFFNRNFHLEPTNLCVFNCKFCSYRRTKGSPDAWDYSMEDMEQIVREQLPIPLQDYTPRTLEERLICYADKFYSKTKLGQDKPMSKIRQHMWKYGSAAVSRFDEMQQFFEPSPTLP